MGERIWAKRGSHGIAFYFVEYSAKTQPRKKRAPNTWLINYKTNKPYKDIRLYYLLKSMVTSFNIVEMIEKNPITRLTGSYQSKLLTKIKQTFTDDEQQLFVASFYSFLNYDCKTEFVIDLDMVWTWLGFSTKQKAKELLEKNFTINKDYKKSLIQKVKQCNYTCRKVY